MRLESIKTAASACFLENDIDGFQSDGGVMSCGNQAGAVWAYNCGVGDGRQHAVSFF